MQSQADFVGREEGGRQAGGKLLKRDISSSATSGVPWITVMLRGYQLGKGGFLI